MLISPGNGLGKSQNPKCVPNNARSEIMIADIGDLLSVIFGGVFIYFSKMFAKKTAEFNSKTFHRQQSETGLRLGFVCCGIIILTLGLLSLLGIVR